MQQIARLVPENSLELSRQPTKSLIDEIRGQLKAFHPLHTHPEKGGLTMSDEEKYSEREFKKRLEEMRWTLLNAYRTHESAPQAFLLGGQSGAGKPHSTRFPSADWAVIIIINGDDYRSSHPRFQALHRAFGDKSVNYTAPWAGRMTEALIDSLSRIGYNLVIEGTLRTAEVPLKTAELLRQRSYGCPRTHGRKAGDIARQLPDTLRGDARGRHHAPSHRSGAPQQDHRPDRLQPRRPGSKRNVRRDRPSRPKSNASCSPRGSWRQRRRSLTHHPFGPDPEERRHYNELKAKLNYLKTK